MTIWWNDYFKYFLNKFDRAACCGAVFFVEACDGICADL